jgi:Bacterial Ig-like domain (group 3)
MIETTQSIRPWPFLAALLWTVLAVGPTHAHDGLAGLQESSTGVLTGAVEELIIDNRVDGTLTYVHSLRQDDGSVVALSGTGAATLQKGARVEVTGNLRGAALEVTGYSVLAAASPVAKAAAGLNPKEVQGTLVVWHKDYFAESHGEYGFGVHIAAGQMTPLNAPGVSPEMLHPGMTVSASGTTASDGVSLDTTQITILAPAPANPNPLGTPVTNNVLVMPIKFSNSATTDPFTPAQIDQVMRTNANSTAAFYNEVSYGQQELNVTVACQTTKPAGCAANTDAGGWLLSTSSISSCDFTTIGDLADAAAAAAGYTISSYNNRFYVFVMPSGVPGCGWAGLAYIGYPYQAWSAGYNALWVYGHELGHNFTLYHAGSVNCGTQVLGGSCSVAEYGDRFDVMGNNSSANQQMHFNAAQKSWLGWIPASSVVTQTSGTKTYTLSPLEAGGQSTYAVKIPVSADPLRTYWIEFRQPIGFDSALSGYPNLGAIIHVSSPFDYPCSSCGGDDTEILDMVPSNGGNFYDAALLVGQTYTDSTYGVSVTVNTASASALSVTVSVAGLPPTTTTITSSLNPSTVGASVTFTANVTGTNPTGNVNFTSDGSSISGCAAVALTGSGNTRRAQCSTNALTQATHSIVANYGGDSGNASSASAALSQVVNAVSSSIDVALAANGGVASASSTYSASFPVAAIINGDRAGLNWGNGGGWNDGTANAWPDWVQIKFSGSETIDQVIVYTLQDNYANPVDPSATLTFSLYGVTAFQVQGWNGSAWVNLGAAVTGNNLVKRTVNFPAFTTTMIRVNITAALASYSRLTEVEAWTSTGPPPSGTTLASSANPSKVSLSVTFTATVTGSNPTGSVAFTSNGSPIAGCTAVALTGSGNSKTAQCKTSFATKGTYSVGANYGGDGTNAPSAAVPLSEIVTRH